MTKECIVVGGGLAGSVAALALARKGFDVAFVAPVAAKPDGRTTALMDQSIRFLTDIDIWAAILPKASALQTMRIIDGTNRLLRTDRVFFLSGYRA